MAQLFNMTADQVINYDGKLPKEVVMEDKNRRRTNEINTSA